VELRLENSDFVALVDDEDYERVASIKWYLNKDGYVYGYFGYGKREYLHRFIMGVEDGRVHIDHRDDNGLNNARTNRTCRAR